MARFRPNFTYALRHSGDKWLGPEFDVEVDVTATIECGEPAFKVHGVYLDMWHREGFPGQIVDDGRCELLSSMDPALAELGKRISAAAMKDETFIDNALDEAGITYRGRGGNDPEGRWVQTRDAAE